MVYIKYNTFFFFFFGVIEIEDLFEIDSNCIRRSSGGVYNSNSSGAKQRKQL